MLDDIPSYNIFCQKLGNYVFDDFLHIPPPDRDTDVLESLKDQWFSVIDECKSPIEQIMGTALLFTGNGYDNLKFSPNCFPIEYPEFGSIFQCQSKIGSYSADFLITCCFKGLYSRVAIECDGHNFHEKTKEQAQRDKARDRYFASKNIVVLRFTGSEIYKDVDKCVEEIEGILFEKIEDVMEYGGAPISRRKKP